MRTGVIMLYMSVAWAMAIAYDFIGMTIGVELDVLRYAAAITMTVGLYLGLHTKDKETSKEEA